MGGQPFLAGLGAKLGLILHHGHAFPYLDQWPGEAMETFTPDLTGKFTLATLFQAHNDHRIVLTRLGELALPVLNGQWDSLLPNDVQRRDLLRGHGGAGMGAGVAAGLAELAAGLGRARAEPGAAVRVGEHALGVPEQFLFHVHFLVADDLAAWTWRTSVRTLAVGDRRRRRFLLFTLATGFLACAAVVMITLPAALRKQADWRRQLPTWGFCAVMVALGLLLKNRLPEDRFQASSAAGFLIALGKGLAWPWAIWWWYAPINLLPLLLLAWYCLRLPEPWRPSESMILGLGAWAALETLAWAYARGADATRPPGGTWIS